MFRTRLILIGAAAATVATLAAGTLAQKQADTKTSKTGPAAAAATAGTSDAGGGGGGESAVGVTPLGTSITYQGQLKVSGAPYIGAADLRFWLYDGAGGSATLIASLTVDLATI